MIGADRALADRQRALIDRLGIGKTVLTLIEIAEIIQRARDIDMIAAQHLFADRQRLLDRRLGVGIAALDLVNLAEIVEEVATAGSAPGIFW